MLYKVSFRFNLLQISVSEHRLMKLRLVVFIVCCLFGNVSLLAQTADTLPHRDTILKTDTPLHPVTDTLQKQIIDTTQHDTTLHTVLNTAPEGYTINGKVEDAHTGEGLPFANIFFPRSSLGTSADLNGNFIIKAGQLPADTLVISGMGYKTMYKRLRKDQHTYNYIIELEREDHELSEHVVVASGEDPALVLMRHVIEHKEYNNPDRTENYKYEAYNRLEADLQRLGPKTFSKLPILKNYSFIYNGMDTSEGGKPFLPLYLTESVSDFYFRTHPKKQREIIKGSMVKGVNNNNVQRYLGSLYQNVNAYRNFIPVFDKKFISPLNDNGPFYYKYTIKDTERAYGHNIILVQFKPRREGENCFTGDFWIVDTVYALQRISMDVSKLANVDWVDRVSLYQEYAPVDSFWFCIKDKFIANFSAYNSHKLPGMIGRKTTTYHNIVINSPSVDSALDNKDWKEDVIISDSDRHRSDEWWAANRPDSLSKTEKGIYKMVDTITSMPITTFYKHLITFLVSGVQDVGPIQLGPYYYLYSSNPVEGNRFRFSFGTPRTLKNLHLNAFVAYGDKDNRFKYGATGLWLLQRDPRSYLYGYYIHDIDHSTNYYDQLGSDNIFSSLFRKPGVPWKLAFSDDQRFEYYKQYHNRFSHKLILEHREYTPYAPLPYQGIFKDVNGNPSNSVTTTEVGVDLRFAYKEKYIDGQYLRVNLGSKYPVFDLQLTAGVKDVLSSGYNYQKARFSVAESINIPPFGHLYYNLFAGKYFGSSLPYPLLEIHPGNEYYYYNYYAFEMMNTYEFISDQYAGFNIEHNIGGGIFNHIPYVKLLKLRQFWTAKGVFGSLSADNQELNLNKGFPFRTLNNNPYLELGTGISNILQIFRIDFVWRVTPKPEANEARSRYFGIFGSVQVQF